MLLYSTPSHDWNLFLGGRFFALWLVKTVRRLKVKKAGTNRPFCYRIGSILAEKAFPDDRANGRADERCYPEEPELA